MVYPTLLNAADAVVQQYMQKGITFRPGDTICAILSNTQHIYTGVNHAQMQNGLLNNIHAEIEAIQNMYAEENAAVEFLLMLDAPSKEVYAVERQLRIFMLIFAVLMIGLVLIFSYLNKKQEIANQKLYKQVERTEKTKESLNTAIFNDILTNVRNRTAFTMDLDKGRPDIEHTCYLISVKSIPDTEQILVMPF